MEPYENDLIILIKSAIENMKLKDEFPVFDCLWRKFGHHRKLDFTVVFCPGDKQ